MTTVEESLAEHERYLIEQIEFIRREYEKAAKPYFDRLIHIRSLRPKPRIILTMEQAKGLGIDLY